MSAMEEDNVQKPIPVLRFVELPPEPNEVERWVIPGYDVVFVDGLFVALQHKDLYRRIFQRYWPLVSGSIHSLPVMKWMPDLLMVTMTHILDMIAEIESVSTARVIVLSRECVNDWLDKVDYANRMGLSVGWLSSLLEELDRTLCRSQSESLEEVSSKLKSVLTGFL